MAFGLFSFAREKQPSRRSSGFFGQGRKLRCESLENREMLSANPVLSVFIHGFGSNGGSGIPGWYASMENIVDSAVLANDAATGSNITSTVRQTIGPDTFSIATVDNTKNVDLGVDWYAGIVSTTIAGVTIDSSSMVGSGSTASALATAIENFLHYEYATYGTTWDVLVVGYSRGGFVAMKLADNLQSYMDANSNSISIGYYQEILLDPTGVHSVDVSLTESNTTYVVPSIVDSCINYNDHMNLAPVACLDGLTMVRSDGSSTGITNVNNKSSMKSYLTDQGLYHWYTVSYIFSYNSHVNMPDWYVNYGQFSIDVANFVSAATVADAAAVAA